VWAFSFKLGSKGTDREDNQSGSRAIGLHIRHNAELGRHKSGRPSSAVLSSLAPFCGGRCELCGSWDLHDADRGVSMMEEATAPMGCRNVLAVVGSAYDEVAEFVMLAAEPAGQVMLFEVAHTSDPPLDPAMVLFKSIIQVDARPVADVAAQH
jgi:hypothetical protein